MGTALHNSRGSVEYIETVSGEDGYPLSYRVWPGHGRGAGTIVFVHGMMSHAGWFRGLAQRLASQELTVIGADRRGSGLNAGNRGDAPFRLALISDLGRIVESRDLAGPIWLAGWCWGALPVLNLALEAGNRLSGIVLLAPGLFPSQTVMRAAQREIVAAKGANPDSLVLGSPITEDLFSDRTDVREFIEHDPLAQRMFTPRFFRIAHEMSLVATERLKELVQPVLLLMAAYDRAVDNERTLQAVRRMSRTEVTTAMLDCNHGMQFELPDEVAARILAWLTPLAAQRSSFA